MTNGHKKSNLFAQSEILRSLRGPHTQDSFAKSLDIPLRTYIRYEKGERAMPRGLLRSAFSIAKNEESVILIDDSLAFTEEGDTIREFVDSFKMNLEVITKAEAEKRKKANTVDPSITSNSSNPLAADPWQDTLNMARKVLESGTDHSGLLASSIKLSFNTIVKEKYQEVEHHKLLKEIKILKQNLSTDGREKEESPAKAAGC
jgi:DNA-binding XRE family transcriptional regulator